ncbi:MAG: oxygen-dependent coproporphyrinogen oxidase [Crocinitomicaceae bacterium]|nr:oxygen-dependent coproporphyrinogen oxidase [Crocinitomicaceae bacterium]
MMRDRITGFLKNLQDEICTGLEAADGSSLFSEDSWLHPSGGGGRSRVIADGRIFDKGGVNFSAVEGDMPAYISEQSNTDAKKFFATGVSIVIHPKSPMVPIIHMNVRYFESENGKCWFGGGIDLTPIYVVPEQSSLFHRQLKKICDKFSPTFYPDFKKAADEYFFIRHRNETRGIGGIFYDYLKPSAEFSTETLFTFMQEVGNAFLKTYLPIVEKNKNLPFTEAEKHWQLIRRGRYVEYNLVYDRGTRFGLETGGRTESILMSLPRYASWEYQYTPAPGSMEEATVSFLKKEIEWTEFRDEKTESR